MSVCEVKLSFREAMEYAKERTIDREVVGMDSESVVFTDGTVVRSRSICHGPYSSWTPDVDMDAPEFFVYQSVEEAGL